MEMNDTTGVAENARAMFYRTLSDLLLNPPLEWHTAQTTEVFEYLGEISGRGGAALRIARRWEEGTEARRMMQDEFLETFVVPIPDSYVPLYASFYLEPEATLWGATTLWVQEMYEDFGLDWRRKPGVMAPDHLGLELAFLGEISAQNGHLLAIGQYGATHLRMLVQEEFLENHLIVWTKALQEEIVGKPHASLGKDLVDVIVGCLEADREQLAPLLLAMEEKAAEAGVVDVSILGLTADEDMEGET